MTLQVITVHTVLHMQTRREVDARSITRSRGVHSCILRTFSFGDPKDYHDAEKGNGLGKKEAHTGM